MFTLRSLERFCGVTCRLYVRKRPGPRKALVPAQEGILGQDSPPWLPALLAWRWPPRHAGALAVLAAALARTRPPAKSTSEPRTQDSAAPQGTPRRTIRTQSGRSPVALRR